MSNEINNTKARIKSKVKSHLPKDWINELRITYRIFMETWYGIKRTGWINLVIITTMAAILLIFGACQERQFLYHLSQKNWGMFLKSLSI